MSQDLMRQFKEIKKSEGRINPDRSWVLQNKEIFVARKPLSPSARRAGWQGFMYDISKIKNSFVRLI